MSPLVPILSHLENIKFHKDALSSFSLSSRWIANFMNAKQRTCKNCHSQQAYPSYWQWHCWRSCLCFHCLPCEKRCYTRMQCWRISHQPNCNLSAQYSAAASCISFVSSRTSPRTVVPLQWKYTEKGSRYVHSYRVMQMKMARECPTQISEFHLQRMTFEYLWNPPHFLGISVTESWVR